MTTFTFKPPVQQSTTDALSKLPKHVHLALSHNEHALSYRTVSEAIANEDHGYCADSWVSPEQREKAIATNECWTLQLYPERATSFYILSAADLDALLEAVREGRDHD